MRLYRVLLHLFPASFRNEYGEEMCVARRRREASWPAGEALVWIEAVTDVAANAARVHRDLLAQDVRYGLRSLGRAPGFAATVVILSALGIGATTAAFSLVDHVLVRPLPYREPDRLVRLYQDQSHEGYARMELSPSELPRLARDGDRVRVDGSVLDGVRQSGGAGEPERLSGVRATFAVLPMLGVAPVLGRFFAEEEDRPGADATVVLSDALWRGTFGGDPGVIGRKILLNDEPHVVIGVMPRGFHFPGRTHEYWVPMRLGRDESDEDRTNNYLYGIARLRDGISMDQARAELRTIAAQLERQYPKENARTGATVIDLRSDLSRQVRLLLIALFGASGCVLLIACMNLGNLLLARALARRREVAVRAALGAGRERLVRQMLTESLMLSAAGGAMGVFVALAATPLVARLVPNTLPIAEVPAADLRVLLFAAAATVATGLAFGLFPALRAGRVGISALAEEARGGSAARTERVRSALVLVEVTASVALLVVTALLVRALGPSSRSTPDSILTGS